MSILTRTMFFDNRNGRIRFFDWNMVGTTLGTMIEPRNLKAYRNGAAMDHDDECAKITDLKCMDRRERWTFLCGGVTLQGGEQIPQNYDFT